MIIDVPLIASLQDVIGMISRSTLRFWSFLLVAMVCVATVSRISHPKNGDQGHEDGHILTHAHNVGYVPILIVNV